MPKKIYLYEISVDGNCKKVDSDETESYKQTLLRKISHYQYWVYFNSGDEDYNSIASSIAGIDIYGSMLVSTDINRLPKFNSIVKRICTYSEKLTWVSSTAITTKKSVIYHILRHYIPYIVDRNDKYEFYLLNRELDYMGLGTKSKPKSHGKSTKIYLYDTVKGLCKSKGLFEEYVKRFYDAIPSYHNAKMMMPVDCLKQFNKLILDNIGSFYINEIISGKIPVEKFKDGSDYWN